MGDTWLTFSLAEDMGTDPNGNPRNAEFAIQVATPEEVDRLYNAFIQTGAKPYMQPKDTQMYNRMRYCEMIRLEFG